MGGTTRLMRIVVNKARLTHPTKASRRCEQRFWPHKLQQHRERNAAVALLFVRRSQLVRQNVKINCRLVIKFVCFRAGSQLSRLSSTLNIYCLARLVSGQVNVLVLCVHLCFWAPLQPLAKHALASCSDQLSPVSASGIHWLPSSQFEFQQSYPLAL